MTGPSNSQDPEKRPYSDAEKVTLANCDREPIHTLGHIQDFGALIAVTSDWIVNHSSANLHPILGIDPSEAFGTPLSKHLPAETLHFLRSRMQMRGEAQSVVRVFGVDVMQDGRAFDVTIHASGRSYIFEFEPKPDGARRDDMGLVHPLIARINAKPDQPSMFRTAAQGMKALTGFDRVMVYRFAEDGTGEVVAEALEPGMEPFLGLRYPASDIPEQARALYKRNLLRIIADVDAKPVPILPELSPEGGPLDLSFSVTRAVSPIHIEYLRNMGVGASMSVSILKKGELWGLFACHHNSPRYVDYELRTAAELLGQMFSYELGQKEAAAEQTQVARARTLHDDIMMQVSSGKSFGEGFAELADRIGGIIPYDGIALYTEGTYTALGSTPGEEEFTGLARCLNTGLAGQIFATSNLASAYPAAEGFGDRVAGVMAMPISRTPRDYIVLFRREVAQSMTWAGNPEKSVTIGPNGSRLSPRKRSDAWREIVKGQSTPWTDAERSAAEALRVTLLEVVLKLTDEANQERSRAQDKQELLIAELNHRVRNILNLIQGLVSQSSQATNNVTDYTRVLGDRIHALARAHDQLTRDDWGPAALVDLIATEVEGFLGRDRDKVEITGGDVRLTPETFSTMALVMHELVTNSVKHGALGAPDGRVMIDLSRQPDGALRIAWVEKGGPQVRAPTRRGFGSTIIERSVPYELKGRANVDYTPTGLEAEFILPAHCLATMPAQPLQPRQSLGMREQAETPVAKPRIQGAVLLVEDNLIIAMDAEDVLADMGADPVLTAASVAEALALIEQHELTLALLDVNLGAETSERVAEKLREIGVPFALASGLGAETRKVPAYEGVPVLNKPYDTERMHMLVAQMLAG